MTKDEALKLALEALEVANSCVDGYYIPKGKTQLPEVEGAITAIKEALAIANPQQSPWREYWEQLIKENEELRARLAQTKQDNGKTAPPKGWGEVSREELIKRELEMAKRLAKAEKALAQPEQEPMAWESVLGAVARGWCYEENANKTMDSELAVAIAKEVHALYTTPPQPKEPEQEPVAWMRDDEMKAMVSDEKRAWILCGRSELIEDYNKPLYTTPPQRTWVGLTDEEIRKAWSQALADTEGEHDLPLNDFASLLQAKLKEKNT